jgi:uncharacterized coiled-coil DUF342 family protein
MKPQSNNSKTNILIIIIGIMAAYNIFQTKNIKTDVSEYNKKIDLIQNGIDSVYTLNEKITEQIVAIDDEIDKVDNDINGVTKNITIIKNSTDEKVNIINSIGNVELEKLFTDRYRE